jgi:hypothetical protein
VFNLETVELEFAKSEGKIFIFVGHTKNGKFEILDAGTNPLSSLDIDDLDAMAAKHKVTSIFLGCNTADLPGVCGFAPQVNSLDIAQQLAQALRSQTYGDFLSNIGSPEIPLIIDKATIENERILVQARRNDSKKNAAITTVIVAASSRFPTAAARFLPMIPEWTENTILLLLSPIFICLAFGMSINWWKPLKSYLKLLGMIVSFMFVMLIAIMEWI